MTELFFWLYCLRLFGLLWKFYTTVREIHFVLFVAGKFEESMSKFESVTVVKAANIYFDGKVTSRTVEFADGSTKTLGVMLPGAYKFNTGKPELMEIQAGELSY